ncbi:MAG: general secretion pathway protein GspB [Lysobacterales bacterium]
MSLILEALRKSEAERQRGMPPRLDSPMLRPIRRRQRLAPGLALLVLGVPVAGWFVYRGMGPEVDTPSETTVGDVALQSLNDADAASAAPADLPPPAPQSSPTTQLAAASGNPSAAVTAPAAAVNRMPAGEAIGASNGQAGGGSFASELSLPPSMRPHTPSLESAEAAPRVSEPVARPSEPVAAASVAAQSVPSAASPAVPAPSTPVVVAAPAPPATSPQQVAMAPAPAPVAAPPVAAPAAPAVVVPMIYELDFSIRRDIPKMDMSMHVYSADPTARFIVVNGKRFGEGDQPETEVQLREIRRDGAVLVFRGTAFVMPRQGF